MQPGMLRRRSCEKLVFNTQPGLKGSYSVLGRSPALQGDGGTTSGTREVEDVSGWMTVPAAPAKADFSKLNRAHLKRVTACW